MPIFRILSQVEIVDPKFSFYHGEHGNHEIRKNSNFFAVFKFLAKIFIFDHSAPAGNEKSY